MYRIGVVLEGLSPFLYNAYFETAGGDISEEQRKEMAWQRAYRDAEGTLILPRNNIDRIIVDCCKEARLKENKRDLWKLAQATVFADAPGSFGVTTCELLSVPGRIPPHKGPMVLIRRPMVPTGWRLSFSLTVIDNTRDHRILREALDRGGLYVGMGSWRPKYGKFKVAQWDVAGAPASPPPAPIQKPAKRAGRKG